MLLGMLERFGGYTLKTLKEESAELLYLLNVEALGRPDPPAKPGEMPATG